MIFQFPLPHEDELLVSILARFVSRQGLRDDKSALDMLFGSRNIVPSALLQGHLQDLLLQVGHIWPVSAEYIMEHHSVLPVFRSFVEPERFKIVQNGLKFSHKSHVLTNVGINASNIKWPRFYRFCPVCTQDDNEKLAYSYWRRLFHLPGVMICPKHHCFLQDSFKLLPERRHRFLDASELAINQNVAVMYVKSDNPLLKLAIDLSHVLNTQNSYVTPAQWSVFYRRQLIDHHFFIGHKTDHLKIKKAVTGFWENAFLVEIGLDLTSENNWLLDFFRKQRRHYSALHHLVCIMALFPSYSLAQAIAEAATAAQSIRKVNIYNNSKAGERAPYYRKAWLKLINQFKVLKEIRDTQEGNRIYSWLFRFDKAWLQKHLPVRVPISVGCLVNWQKRDFELVKQLIRIRNQSYDDLSLPRMTQTWFIAKTNVSWGVESHLSRMPLCQSFFVKYTESIDEYQIRRVLAIMVECIKNRKAIPRAYEIERIAGLSKNRSRQAVRLVLELDFKAFSCNSLAAEKSSGKEHKRRFPSEASLSK